MKLTDKIHLTQHQGKVYVTSVHEAEAGLPAELSNSLALSASADIFKELDAEFHQTFTVAGEVYVQWVLVSDYEEDDDDLG